MRRPKIVASVALIAAFAVVAVPVPVGSRAPSPLATVDPDLFETVEIAALARGTTMTILPPDQGARSDGTLDGSSTLVEPDLRLQPLAAPVRAAQPAPAVRAISKSTQSTNSAGSGWHHDNNISWFGPHLYGNGMACGKKLTKEVVGVAHRTLRCGTLVTFRYRGTTVTVPVVDRGPYVSGRTWDLTHGACVLLHHCFTGSIDWRLGSGS